MTIYNTTDYSLHEVDMNVWNTWVANNHPRATRFAILPDKPQYDPKTYNCVWGQGVWELIAKPIPPNRKVWPTAAHFWGEFTETEQLSIVSRNETEVKYLIVALSVWPSEVWSDDPRVVNAMQMLVSRNILTAQRVAQLLAPPNII